jgi:hypothetical protein
VTTPPSWAAPDGGSGQPPEQPAAGGPPGPPPAPAAGAPDWQAAPGWGGPPAGYGQPPAGPAPAHGQPGHGPPPGWGAPQGYGPPPGWSRPPDVQPGVVPLRPLGLGELLDGAVGVVRRYPRPTLGLSAAVALVTTLLNVPLLLQLFDSPLLDPTSLSPGSDVALDAEIGGLVAGFGASGLLSFLSGVVLAGIITAVVGRAVLGQPMSVGEAWTTVRPLLLRLLALSVVVALGAFGAAVGGVAVGVGLAVGAGVAGALLGVPLAVAGVVLAVHLYVRWALAASAVVLERASLAQSLRRSATLVKGDWWRVFGILLLVLVITSFISQVLQTPFAARSLFAGADGEPAEFGALDVVLTSIGSALSLAVVAPFGAAVSALLYVDRRMRAEGLDVALGAAAAASRTA